jgi:hypothetical protein
VEFLSVICLLLQKLMFNQSCIYESDAANLKNQLYEKPDLFYRSGDICLRHEFLPEGGKN